MRKIKKKIIKFIDRLLIHTAFYQKTEQNEKVLRRAININYLLTPEVLPLTKDSKRILVSTECSDGYENVNFNISKDDLMFHFWLHHTGSINNALVGYIKSGIEHANIIKSIVSDTFGTTDIEVLDFASGHGRVSRFLCTFLPRENVTVSDIKKSAVLFQQTILNLKGFNSPNDPTDLNVEKKFDLVVVSSLFTHLNRRLFVKWITALGKLLNKNGVLALSLHIMKDGAPDGFKYTDSSEDDLFPETSENLSGKNTYGLTYVTKAEFINILNSSLGFSYKIINEQPWGNSQILFSIQKSNF